MTRVIYKLVRRDRWTEKYRFSSSPLDYEGMSAMAYSVYVHVEYSPADEWQVIGGTSRPRLALMLDRLNAGETACNVSLAQFLKGRLDEDQVREIESEIIERVNLFKHAPGPEETAWVQGVMKGVLERVFDEEIEELRRQVSASSELKAFAEETPDTPAEELQEQFYPYYWSAEEQKRLQFARWLYTQKLITDEIKA